MIGHPIHPYAARTLEQLGADPTNFAARQLSAAIASDADLVITMTKAQRDDVVESAPQQLHKTFMLSEISRIASRYHPKDLSELAVLRPQLPTQDRFDVADPIGRSQEFFDSVGTQIADLVDPLVQLCVDHSA